MSQLGKKMYVWQCFCLKKAQSGKMTRESSETFLYAAYVCRCGDAFIRDDCRFPPTATLSWLPDKMQANLIIYLR